MLVLPDIPDETKISRTDAPIFHNSIVISCGPVGSPGIQICEDGCFYVKGNLLAKDEELYHAFVELLKDGGYYHVDCSGHT